MPKFEASKFRVFILTVMLSIVPLSLPTIHAQSLQKEEIKQQAEAQLQQMSPEEINAKIKELGMTRQEAEKQAKDLGIDLDAFLQQKAGVKPAAAPPPQEPLPHHRSQGPDDGAPESLSRGTLSR